VCRPPRHGSLLTFWRFTNRIIIIIIIITDSVTDIPDLSCDLYSPLDLFESRSDADRTTHNRSIQFSAGLGLYEQVTDLSQRLLVLQADTGYPSPRPASRCGQAQLNRR